MGAWKRFRGKSGPQPLFSKRAYKSMQRANHLMDGGDHANAAVLLEEVALSAHDRGIDRPAAFLYLQAARAYLLGGQVEHGADLLRRGLNVLAKMERWPVLLAVGQRAVDDLGGLGLPDLASEIEAWLASARPPDVEDRAVQPEQRSRLPRMCPACGAVVRPEEVEQADGFTICAYCSGELA